MTEKKFVVTKGLLNDLVQETARRFVGDSISEMGAYQKCLQTPYVEPAEDWRKKWKDVDKDGDQVLFAVEENGSTHVVLRTAEGLTSSGNGHRYLIPIEPETVKVEQWALIYGNEIWNTHLTEAQARSAAVSLRIDNPVIVKLEGSYTK